jgi:hypothetical protein
MWDDLMQKHCRPKQLFFAGLPGQFITCPQCGQRFLGERSLYSDTMVSIPRHYDHSDTGIFTRRYSRGAQ